MGEGGAAPVAVPATPPGYLTTEEASDKRRQQHECGGKEADGPDQRAPGPQAEVIGWDIEHTRAQIGEGEGGGEAAGLAGEGDHRAGDGEEDQPLEVIAQGAAKAGGAVRHLPGGFAIARGGRV